MSTRTLACLIAALVVLGLLLQTGKAMLIGLAIVLYLALACVLLFDGIDKRGPRA